MTPAPAAHQLPPVSVVIPVYGNLEATRRCLGSVHEGRLPDNAGVLVINDASPDARIRDYCRAATEEYGWDYLENDSNLGFVASANRGFGYRPNDDVVLLNSDTHVPGDWIQRLRECAYRESTTGTVTPFSNNATICSYPGFPCSSELPDLWDAASLDTLIARTNAGLSAEIPTAVGFCMYIKRKCLRETGQFDEANFGHGYGEECDFCMRAAARGWKHVLAGDLYVFHQGGASFGGASDARKVQADLVMNRIHPGYGALVEEFIASDPVQPLRRNIDLARIEARPQDLVNVLNEHAVRYRRAEASLRESRQSAQDMRHELTAALQQQEERADTLDSLLNDCRERFARADGALAEATRLVEQMRAEIGTLAEANDRLTSDLQQQILLAAGLRDRIHLMENSRSWRYTAWLRRE